MSTSVAITIVRALSQVSADAAPGLVDAVLLTTQCSASALLLGVLQQFPRVYEVMQEKQSSAGTGERVNAVEAAAGEIYKYLVTVVHLLKKEESKEEDLLKSIWTVFVPLLRGRNPAMSSVQIQVAEMLADAIAARTSWHAIKRTLLPLCLNSLYPSWQLRDDLALAEKLECRGYSWWQRAEKDYRIVAIHSIVGSQEELFSLHAVSQLLAALLNAALQEIDAKSFNAVHGKEMELNAITEFCLDMVSFFLASAFAKILQPQDETMRLCAMQTILPPLLKCASRFGWRDDVSPEKRIVDDRTSPMQEVWSCCKILSSRGSSERRDAYMALALFSDLLLQSEFDLDHFARSTNMMSAADSDKKFDIRGLAEFWEMLKIGLGDGDSLTRKRALHVLKKALFSIYSSSHDSTKSDEHGTGSLQGNIAEKISIKTSSKSISSKREKWADAEASFSNRETYMREQAIPGKGLSRRWEAFLLLHETLEEYGIHLVEAAWNNQMSFLLQFTKSKGESKDSGPYWIDAWSPKGSLSIDVNFAWIAVLWQRGFDSTNPQVRRLVMVSFLEFEWDKIRKLSHLIPEDYIVGTLVRALDDPVHHRDFGMKGVYSSGVAEGAAKFVRAYGSSLSSRRRLLFVVRFTKSILSQSLSRSGLMTLTMCLEAAAVAGSSEIITAPLSTRIANDDPEFLRSGDDTSTCLELLWNVVENSKRQFNPKYREKACGHVLRAVTALNVIPIVPFRTFAFFLSSLPKELLTYDGPLRNQLTSWITSAKTNNLTSHTVLHQWLAEGLQSEVEQFLEPHGLVSSVVTDEDIVSWRVEGGRCARLLALGLVDASTMSSLLMWTQEYALQTYGHTYKPMSARVKLLVFIQSLLQECSFPPKHSCSRPVLNNVGVGIGQGNASNQILPVLIAGVSNLVMTVLETVVDYARRSAGIFKEYEYNGVYALPASVSGKLGGPSQRRLPADLTSATLEAVVSISTVAKCCLWHCSGWPSTDIPESIVTFLWSYAWTIATSPAVMNQVRDATGLSRPWGSCTFFACQLLCLGRYLPLFSFGHPNCRGYEALTFVCSALAATAHPFFVTAAHASMTPSEGEPSPLPVKAEQMVDGFIRALIKNVDDAHLVGALARSRRSVLTAHKWCCLDALLSIPEKAVASQGDRSLSSISNQVLEGLLHDCIDSLECAGEEYILPLLRCVRWLMQWGVLEHVNTDDDPENKYQVMWMLVQSGWSAVADANKRRVATTAAFLSAMFHPATFSDLEMHGSLQDESEHGPLKWLLNRLIDQGVRSPRTMRLTALHVTGLWLMFPRTALFYFEELKILALHGGESVDEELDGEIVESQTSAREYATLIESTDPELTEEFTNSEMYVRVIVAVMLDRFATLSESVRKTKNEAASEIDHQAHTFGQKFLVKLLEAAVKDADLCKELYKKKSAIHRRKVRLWQLLCISSKFVSSENVAEVTGLLKLCLHMNNFSSVRQFIEVFAIHTFLNFPHLIEEALIPALYDYTARPQALASYVLISGSVLMFAPASSQSTLLHQILPAILPLMTSHHHSLRSFTQVLVYRIIRKFADSERLFESYQAAFPQGQCLRSIADYLEGNADCAKMRNAVEKNFGSFDPISMTRPRGIFCIKDGEADLARTAEDHPFECVPVALLDQVGMFLNEAREELRESMAADALKISTERFQRDSGSDRFDSRFVDTVSVHDSGEAPASGGRSTRNTSSNQGDYSLFNGNSDIQKKLFSHRLTDDLAAFDKENEILLSSIESRAKDVMRLRGGRQELIVVASLLGRIPNLAGLARTCEVFKASKLVVTDASIAQDRQFQMISVTADQWIPLVEVPEAALGTYFTQKRKEGYAVLGLEQTAQSVSIDKYVFPGKVVLVLGREADGIPVNIIQALDLCLEIPQLGVIRSLNVHVSGAIAIWEYTRQHLSGQKV